MIIIPQTPVPLRLPVNIENIDKASVAIPDEAYGCYVTLIGGGGAGGYYAGAGGGGGGRVDRTWVPVSLMGATYSLTRGAGGIPNGGSGGDSVFTSGSVTLTAGGGTPGTGGVASAVGITAVTHSGSNQNTNELLYDAGAGGGSGGTWDGYVTPTAGPKGGNSMTVTGGASGGGSAADAALGHGGAGGGGAWGGWPWPNGPGGNGGLYGGGGGGGGAAPNGGSSGGYGGAGYTKIEWVFTPQ